MVVEWYEARGYTVLARNWRVRAGEIDVVVHLASVIVVCEVKTRSRTDFGVPAFAVNRDKQRRLRRLAAQFLSEHPVRGAHVRFDVAEVVGSPEGFSVNVIESAF